MDINHNQTAQMVAWLDEERRKDKSTITKLEERVASQNALINDQTRRLQTLETEIASLKTMTISSSMFEETVGRLRDDLVKRFDKKNDNRASVVDELKKTRELDREAMNKALEELRQDIASRIDRELQPRRAEEERLSKVAFELQAYSDNLKKGLEEFERTLTFLEEQRRQDSRRISELNGEIGEMVKRMDIQIPKVELLEELSRRNERSLNDIAGGLEEFRQEQRDQTEHEALLANERERLMNDMVKRMETFANDMQGYKDQFSHWSDTHLAMRKDLEEFNRIADRVDRRLNELAEVQRLSEERFRHEWEQWQQDDQKRWRQFTVTNDEQWRENGKLNESLLADIAKINDRMSSVIANLRYMRNMEMQFLKKLGELYSGEHEEFSDEMKSLPDLG